MGGRERETWGGGEKERARERERQRKRLGGEREREERARGGGGQREIEIEREPEGGREMPTCSAPIWRDVNEDPTLRRFVKRVGTRESWRSRARTRKLYFTRIVV